jgi:hypothetical protein
MRGVEQFIKARRCLEKPLCRITNYEVDQTDLDLLIIIFTGNYKESQT